MTIGSVSEDRNNEEPSYTSQEWHKKLRYEFEDSPFLQKSSQDEKWGNLIHTLASNLVEHTVFIVVFITLCILAFFICLIFQDQQKLTIIFDKFEILLVGIFGFVGGKAESKISQSFLKKFFPSQTEPSPKH